MALILVKVIQYYNSLLNDFDCIIIEKADYSYNELSNICNEAVNILTETYDISSYYVDIKKNKAIVTIANNELPESKYYVSKNYDINSDNLQIIYGEHVQTEATLTGGNKITNSANLAFTLGVCGSYGGYSSILTCGHDQSLSASIYQEGSLIGTVAYLRYSSSTSGDFSIVKTPSVTLTNKVKTSSGTKSITGTVSSPAIGTYVYKYGQVSGEALTYVNAVNVNVTSCKGLTRATLISGNTQGGDSGGPYTIGNSFCGIHHGTAGGDVFFTPYYYMSSAGFVVKTN